MGFLSRSLSTRLIAVRTLQTVLFKQALRACLKSHLIRFRIK